MEELKINVTSENGEVIVRTGEALPLFPKTALKLNGTIESVLDFAKKRESVINKLTAHVVLCVSAGTVLFVVDETDNAKQSISGSLILHKQLDALYINTGKTFGIQDLANIFKLNRRFFVSRDEHMSLLSSMNDLKVKTSVEFQNANDFAGTTLNSKLVKVTHGIPLKFTLRSPLFEGHEPNEIPVTIEVIPDNGSIRVSLVSVEMAEMIDLKKEEIFTKVRNELAEYVLIEQ